MEKKPSKTYISRLTAKKLTGGYEVYYINIPKELVEKMELRKGDVFLLEPIGKEAIIIRKLVPA